MTCRRSTGTWTSWSTRRATRARRSPSSRRWPRPSPWWRPGWVAPPTSCRAGPSAAWCPRATRKRWPRPSSTPCAIRTRRGSARAPGQAHVLREHSAARLVGRRRRALPGASGREDGCLNGRPRAPPPGHGGGLRCSPPPSCPRAAPSPPARGHGPARPPQGPRRSHAAHGRRGRLPVLRRVVFVGLPPRPPSRPERGLPGALRRRPWPCCRRPTACRASWWPSPSAPTLAFAVGLCDDVLGDRFPRGRRRRARSWPPSCWSRPTCAPPSCPSSG